MTGSLRELTSKARPFVLGGRGGGNGREPMIADEGDRASVARDMILTFAVLR
jgi:hypothetical protein